MCTYKLYYKAYIIGVLPDISVRLDLASEETKVCKYKWLIEKKKKQIVSLHTGKIQGEELEGTLEMFYLNYSS